MLHNIHTAYQNVCLCVCVSVCGERLKKILNWVDWVNKSDGKEHCKKTKLTDDRNAWIEDWKKRKEKKVLVAEGVEKLYQVNMCIKSNSHLTNLFVQRDAKKIANISNWKSHCIHPLSLVCAVYKYDKCLHEMYIVDLCY